MKVTPGGAWSSTVTSEACEGPALCTTICHLTWPPATGFPDSTDFTVDRSAELVTGSDTVEVAPVGSLSKLLEDAVAVLVSQVVRSAGSLGTAVAGIPRFTATVRTPLTGTS